MGKEETATLLRRKAAELARLEGRETRLSTGLRDGAGLGMEYLESPFLEDVWTPAEARIRELHGMAPEADWQVLRCSHNPESGWHIHGVNHCCAEGAYGREFSWGFSSRRHLDAGYKRYDWSSCVFEDERRPWDTVAA